MTSEHWEAAGELGRAALLALQAARSAEQSAAFERAVSSYRRALRLGVERPDLVKASLGRAMSWAGFGDAADVLLAAAAEASGPARAALERDAAHQLLRSGQVERAYALLPKVVADLGMRWPANKAMAIAEILWNVGRAKVPFSIGRPTPPDTLRAVMELAMSLSYADQMRTAVFSTRAIVLAASVQEPELRAVASAMRGSNAALLGDLDESVRYLERAWSTLPDGADEVARASVALHEGIADVVLGRFPRAATTLDGVVRAFEDRGGRPYELNMARNFLLYAVLQCGRIGEYRALRNRAIEECRLRGMKGFEVLYRTTYPLSPGLLDDDDDAQEANLREAATPWGGATSSVWLFAQCSWVQHELATGRIDAAAERAERLGRVAEANGLLRITPNAIYVEICRASTAAQKASRDPAARSLLRDAVERIARIPSPMSRASSEVWRATSLAIEGRHDEALRANERTLHALDEVPVAWHRPLVLMQRARLRGEPDDAPAAELIAMGVRAPRRLLPLYAWAP